MDSDNLLNFHMDNSNQENPVVDNTLLGQHFQYQLDFHLHMKPKLYLTVKKQQQKKL